jgi:hypothetical protein
MTDQQRDWDKELAEIDRLIANQPAGAAPKPVPAGKAAPAPADARGTTTAPKGGRWPAWIRAGLGLALAVAMTQWPYAHACGLGLMLYLGAAGVVVIAGFWTSVSGWKRRSAGAHVLGLLVTLAGMGLIAAEVLPRIGYAKQAAVWMCG